LGRSWWMLNHEVLGVFSFLLLFGFGLLSRREAWVSPRPVLSIARPAFYFTAVLFGAVRDVLAEAITNEEFKG